MRGVRAAMVLLACCVGSAMPASRARADDAIAPEELTDEHVRTGIDAIVAELYRRKHPSHFWDPAKWNASVDGSKFQTGGYTALATLALLYAGETYQDPRLRDAVADLEKARLVGTYAVAIRANVWAKLPPKFAGALASDTSWLLEGFSPTAAGWAYEKRPATTRRDNSIRQYGALALWEAAKRGLAIDDSFWRALEDAFIECQLPDGGWNYRGDEDPATGSMTAAGLATLFITQDFLHADESIPIRGTGSTRNQAGIDRGLAWMNANFMPDDNPGSFRDFYYYLYGVERVGLASGVKHFGAHDWYREGAAELLRRLCTWDPATRTMTVNEHVGGKGNAARIQVRHLAFGLMFLSRGRVPVAFNKLRIPDFPWNNRPRDVANLTRSITEMSETLLSWQIVGLDAPPESWLDAPILYIASNRALPFSDPASPEARKLARYLDLGGMILAVDEGAGNGLAASVEALGARLYPNAEWRALPPDHWAYTIHGRLRGNLPPLRGLSNGVRDLIIVSPIDLSASYQSGAPDSPESRRGSKTRPTVAADHFALGANLFFYASELNRPRPRLARHHDAGPSDFVQAKRAVRLAVAIPEGEWNREPLAGEVLRTALARTHDLEVRVSEVALASLGELSPPPAVALVGGIEAHVFTAAERDAVARFVAAGGVVVFETIGGLGSFAQSAERTCTELFGAPIRPIHRSPLVTGLDLPGGRDLSHVEYRPYSLEYFGARETVPHLRGIEIDGDVRVVFSREDLTHALLDQPCWGISGYAPASARDLIGNLLLAGLERRRE